MKLLKTINNKNNISINIYLCDKAGKQLDSNGVGCCKELKENNNESKLNTNKL